MWPRYGGGYEATSLQSTLELIKEHQLNFRVVAHTVATLRLLKLSSIVTPSGSCRAYSKMSNNVPDKIKPFGTFGTLALPQTWACRRPLTYHVNTRRTIAGTSVTS